MTVCGVLAAGLKESIGEDYRAVGPDLGEELAEFMPHDSIGIPGGNIWGGSDSSATCCGGCGVVGNARKAVLTSSWSV
jgi:hypothetical protein